MANPIIKIKRGSGVPTSAGITAGEFAFNKTGNILYVGACGGYTGYDGSSSFGARTTTNNDLNIIPIGMQISNDPEMGAGADIDARAGYSNFTVPTTKAVRDWVNQTKMNQVLGATFRAGPGIGITSDQDPGSTQYDVTISNTGVIKGFTGFNVIGNSHPLSDVVKAKSAIDGITFIGGGGIRLRGTNSQTSLEIQNIGVTSIGGFTGTINTFSPIVNLDGFTAGIGLAVRQVVSGASPIVVGDANVNGFNGINISHSNQGIGSNSGMVAYINGVPQLLTVAYDTYGHMTSAPTQTNLNFGAGGGLPIGFAQAVQDAAYPGITNFYGPNNYGIDYVYDDNNNRLKTINRGITSLSATGQLGLSGAVILAVGIGYGIPLVPQLSVVQTKNDNTITYEYIGKQYKSFSLIKPTIAGYPSTGIYLGGVTGAGVGTNTAASPLANLSVIPGRGIGISMGAQGGLDTMLIWNYGINTITAFDGNSNPLGGGLSGDINLNAGTNIVFTRNANSLTISSSGGGGGGAVGYLHANYTTDPTEDYAEYWGGDGLTGGIQVLGENGILVKQDTVEGAHSTKDGRLIVGLTSRIKIPAGIVPSLDFPNAANVTEIEIATSRESGIPNLPTITYLDNPQNYSRLVTDTIEGGFTGEFSYGIGFGSFNPQPPVSFDAAKSYPGRILSLRAREGLMDLTTTVGAPSFGGVYAELRLLGYPNPESMSAYINDIYDHTTASLNTTGCPNGNCIGYPAVLPPCNIGLDEVNQKIYYHTDGTGEFDTAGNGDGREGQLRGTAVFHSNVVARDSLFVQKDIWLTGELIDATTGCLYAAGAGGGGGTNVFNGGNLGLTGDLIVNGSIYVHGGTAFFNVDNISTESGLIRMGGISGSTEYSEEMNSLVVTNNPPNLYGDRGLYLFSAHSHPYSSNTGLGPNPAVASRQSFIGIDVSDSGMFKYQANVLLSSENGTHTVTGGRLGSAKFADINFVGITSDYTTISLKAGTVSPNVTNIDLRGHVEIIGQDQTGKKATINLADKVKVSFGSLGSGSVIGFERGITFYPNTLATGFEGMQNNLRIQYAATDDTSRTISIRNPGANKFIQLVDTGKYAGSDSSTTPGFVDLGQQTIYNKTLADGTIIDCGTY